MIKKFLLAFIVLALASILGTYLVTEPGLVFIHVGAWTIETNLAVAITILFVLFLLFYIFLRALRILLTLSTRFKQFYRRHQLKQGQNFTSRGLIELAQGNWIKAEKYLLKAINIGEYPLINYLGAAFSADGQGAKNRRDKYFKKAKTLLPQAHIAISLIEVKTKIRAKEFEQAKILLKHLQSLSPRNKQVLHLLKTVYLELKDWPALKALIPQLEKNHEDTSELKENLYIYLLSEEKNNLEKLQETWRQIPKSLRHYNTNLIKTYCACLLHVKADAIAELILTNYLKQNYQAVLMDLYGKTQGQALKQLELAEKWLKDHEHDPILLLTLGKLAKRNQLWGKAKAYLENSLHYKNSPECVYELANLLIQLGEKENALALYAQSTWLVV